jgi:DNA repair exonuclease SbcCD ATPase subunit
MKTTETYEQLLERFTKRIKQIESKEAQTTAEYDKINEQLQYLKGCKDTIEYLMTGKLPNDGNHDGMKSHKPRHPH